VVGAVLLSGCASTSDKKVQQRNSNIVALRNDLISVKRAADSTVTALNIVVEEADSDPTKAFESFSKSLAKLDSAVVTIKTRAQELKTQNEAILKVWEAELKEVENVEVHKLAEARRAKLKEAFAKISPLIAQAKADFEPFTANVHDLQKYLNNDLTLGGIDAAKPLIARTVANGRAVQTSLEALIAEMNTAAATIMPPKKIK
jgi:hypothetical protein